MTTTRTESAHIPASFELGQNYPNPFRESTRIPFTLQESAGITLSVYDLLGRQVAVIKEGMPPPGKHEVVAHLPGLPAGVYVYRLAAADRTETRIMSVLK